MSIVPNQRKLDYGDGEPKPGRKPTRVVTRTLVLIERDESLERVYYKDLSPEEVVKMLKEQPLDGPNGMIQEFVDDVQSTKTEELFIVRTVKLKYE